MEKLTPRQKLSLASWIVVLCLALGLGYLFNYLSLDSDLNWTRELYLKKVELADTFSGERRMLVFGGSGTHYSIDTNMLEAKLGIPVFNMGLHGGLGLHVILECALFEARDGDIILLVPEHGLLNGKGDGWLSSAFGVAIGKPGIGGVSLEEKSSEILRGGMTSLPTFGKSIWKLLFGAKGRASYMVDDRGNALEFMPGTASPICISNSVSDYNLERLKLFHDKLDARGVTLLFSLPSVLIAKDDDSSLEVMKDRVQHLSWVAPVICDEIYNAKTDSDMFSDSAYHLNNKGRSISSEKLVLELGSALKNNQP